jgi:hypothetical protein
VSGSTLYFCYRSHNLYKNIMCSCKLAVAYLRKARTAEAEKQPLLGDGCLTRNSGVTVGRVFFVRGPHREYITRSGYRCSSFTD